MALLALGVIGAWLLVLVIGFNLYLSRQLTAQSEQKLRVRAQAASATVAVVAGRVVVRESATDSALDSDIWVFAGPKAIERPPASAQVQQAVGSLARSAQQGYEVAEDNRFYVLPVTVGGDRVAIVIAATSTESEGRAEKISLAGSVIVAGLVLAVAYPVVRLAARRALDPMDEMARRAADWSAHETSRRFGGRQRYAELSELAVDLDGLLDRLSAVLRHERQLSGELSHELRTPLARIAAEADLLVKQGHSADRGAHLAIAETARSMDRIIDTLLDAARAQVTGPTGVCGVHAVLDVLDHDDLVRTGDADVVVGVDAAVVERIIAPVLDNARRHAVGRVQVDVMRDGGAVQVDVLDDGPGVAADLADHVFEPGVRADDGHTGAGLGLPLARRLARAADGDVALVASEHGARFRVTLPAG